MTPAVCRASAGAVEHLAIAVVPNLAATSRTSRAPGCGRTPPPPTAAKRSGRPTFPGVSCSSSAQRERACDRSSDAPATRPSAFPARTGRIFSTSASPPRWPCSRRFVSAARRSEHGRTDSLPVRRPQPAARRRFADAAAVVDTLASFVGCGAPVIVVFDGAGADRDVGPLAVRYAPHADTLLERLAAEHRGSEIVCLVSSDAAVRGVSGQEVRKVSSGSFLAEPSKPATRTGRQPSARPARPPPCASGRAASSRRDLSSHLGSAMIAVPSIRREACGSRTQGLWHRAVRRCPGSDRRLLQGAVRDPMV